MKRNFARHGIPDECISDNGPQFDSYEYSRFARDYGFNLVKSSPYYSRGNGKAESAVKIAKNILKKSRHEDPYLALLAYRNTPQQGHAYSPAQRLMSRRLRDLIPMATSQLRPQTASPRVVVQDIVGRRQRSKMQYDKKASTLQREFSPGEKVFVKPNPKNKHKPWIYGEVVGNPAPRACLLSTPLGPIRRNHSQIRKAHTKPHYQAEPADLETASLTGADDVPTVQGQQSTQPVAEQNQQTGQTAVEQNQQADQPVPGALDLEPTQSRVTQRRSTRRRNMPSKFKDYVMNIVHSLRPVK